MGWHLMLCVRQVFLMADWIRMSHSWIWLTARPVLYTGRGCPRCPGALPP